MSEKYQPSKLATLQLHENCKKMRRQDIDFTTGRVDSSDTTKDLNASYHHEIDKL
jgi:hypothetical protein